MMAINQISYHCSVNELAASLGIQLQIQLTTIFCIPGLQLSETAVSTGIRYNHLNCTLYLFGLLQLITLVI
jgi:hypothetical protein